MALQQPVRCLARGALRQVLQCLRVVLAHEPDDSLEASRIGTTRPWQPTIVRSDVRRPERAISGNMRAWRPITIRLDPTGGTVPVDVALTTAPSGSTFVAASATSREVSGCCCSDSDSW